MIDDPKFDKQKIAEAYRATFGTPVGRVVLADILTRVCGMGQPLFRPDQFALAYNAALHDVGIAIERLARGHVSTEKPEVKI